MVDTLKNLIKIAPEVKLLGLFLAGSQPTLCISLLYQISLSPPLFKVGEIREPIGFLINKLFYLCFIFVCRNKVSFINNKEI